MKQYSKVAHTRCMSLLQKGEENKMCKSYMMIPISIFLQWFLCTGFYLLDFEKHECFYLNICRAKAILLTNDEQCTEHPLWIDDTFIGTFFRTLELCCCHFTVMNRGILMNRPASQNWVPDDPCQVTICRLIALSIVVHQRPDCCPQGDQARYQRLLQPLIVSSGMVTRFCTPPPPIIIKSFSDDVSWPGRDSSNSLIFLLINIMAKLMHMHI